MQTTETRRAVAEALARPISAAELIHRELIKAGIKLVVTVPDSKITELYSAIANDSRIDVLRVAKEDEGIGICCGAFFGGVNSCLLMANAGFMVTCYPLATLSSFSRIPLFMLISNRGTLGDNAHFQEYQGLLTQKMLEAMGISAWVLEEPDKVSIISKAFKHSRLYKRPVAVLMQGDMLDSSSDFRYLKPGVI